MRRRTLSVLPLLTLLPHAARADSFGAFVAGVRAQARGEGISEATLDAAFAGVRPNQTVIDKDHHQAEFTLTWPEYRERIVSDKRLVSGRVAVRRQAGLLTQVSARYGVDAGVIGGIWGIESNFGDTRGTYNVVESLATLAWEGRRAAFFRAELMAALKILQRGDITPARMTSSWAGAMGQPQFMPTSFVRMAVDWDGDGRRDIWDDSGDVFASIANYLAVSGWRAGEPWGQPVRVPAGFASGGRDDRRTLAEWTRAGVRRPDATAFGRPDAVGAVIVPDGGTEAFMVYANFGAIRRYNPSDFYALAVGLLGDGIRAG